MGGFESLGNPSDQGGGEGQDGAAAPLGSRVVVKSLSLTEALFGFVCWGCVGRVVLSDFPWSPVRSSAGLALADSSAFIREPGRW